MSALQQMIAASPDVRRLGRSGGLWNAWAEGRACDRSSHAERLPTLRRHARLIASGRAT